MFLCAVVNLAVCLDGMRLCLIKGDMFRVRLQRVNVEERDMIAVGSSSSKATVVKFGKKRWEFLLHETRLERNASVDIIEAPKSERRAGQKLPSDTIYLIND